MASQFHGTADELKAAVAQVANGDWTEKDGKLTFRSKKGAILNFWQSNGTLQFQGKADVRTDFEDKVAQILESDGDDFVASEVAALQTGKEDKVFIVHGHDVNSREQLELILRRMGITPFILQNNASGGLTIIEALEKNIGKSAEARFGIVLMTPDDHGYSDKDGAEKIEPRARQNVVMEMGMLLASLTRKNVAILVKGHIELPSDASGIIYLHFNNHVKEVATKLAQCLREAGFDRITPEMITAASQ